MGTRLRILLLIALVVPVLQIRSQQPADAGIVFSTQIQPILARNCQGCHQGGAAPADLHLDSAAGVLKGSVSGKVIVAGNSVDSLLYQRVTGKDGILMPPTGRSLADPEIALIKKWIDEGAKIDAAALAADTNKPKHWSYV
jgi:mono/diheme cytochrome c family protein